MLCMRLLVPAEVDGAPQRGHAAQGHPSEVGVRLPEGQISMQGVPEQMQPVQEGNHVPAAAPVQWAVPAVLAEPENVVDVINAWRVGI